MFPLTDTKFPRGNLTRSGLKDTEWLMGVSIMIFSHAETLKILPYFGRNLTKFIKLSLTLLLPLFSGLVASEEKVKWTSEFSSVKLPACWNHSLCVSDKVLSPSREEIPGPWSSCGSARFGVSPKEKERLQRVDWDMTRNLPNLKSWQPCKPHSSCSLEHLVM